MTRAGSVAVRAVASRRSTRCIARRARRRGSPSVPTAERPGPSSRAIQSSICSSRTSAIRKCSGTAARGSGSWPCRFRTAIKVRFFGSKDLKAWTPLSTFGPAGAVAACGNVPTLMRVPVDGSTEWQWVLAVSVSEGAPAGGTGDPVFRRRLRRDTIRRRWIGPIRRNGWMPGPTSMRPKTGTTCRPIRAGRSGSVG